MLFARDIKEKELQLVLVFKDILEIHSLLVDQNVLKIQIAQEIECAGIKSVLILAQDFVALMLSAQFQTMYQVVIVYKVTLVTHLWLVTQVRNLKNIFTTIFCTFNFQMKADPVKIYFSLKNIFLDELLVDLVIITDKKR